MTYLLEHPRLLASLFAGHLPAVSVFFGIAYFLLRSITKIRTRSALALAYFVSPALLLALGAWDLRVDGYGAGTKLLGPLVLSTLSCAVLYYHEWKRQSTESAAMQASQIEVVKNSEGIVCDAALAVHREQQAQTETTKPNIENATVKEKTAEARLDIVAEHEKTDSRASWLHEHILRGLNLPIVIFVGFVLLILGQSLGISSLWDKPNYIVEDSGAFGYQDTRKGAADKALKLYRYAGIHNGKHQVYSEYSQGGEMTLALECAEPCNVIKELSFWPRYTLNFGPNKNNAGVFYSKRFIPADAESIESKVMQDAINGHLMVHGLDAVVLKTYGVPIEKSMEGIPVRPLFSELGVRFEYMAAGPRTETTTQATRSEPNIDGRKSNDSALVAQDAPKQLSSQSESGATSPTLTKKREDAETTKAQIDGQVKNESTKVIPDATKQSSNLSEFSATSPTSNKKPGDAKTTKGQRTSAKPELNKSTAESPSSSVRQVDSKTTENQGTSEELEIKKLTAAHPDWLEQIKTAEFRYWSNNVISDGKALMGSNDAEYISRRLSEFKKWKKELNY